MPEDSLVPDDKLDDTIGSPLAHALYAPTTYPSAQCHVRSDVRAFEILRVGIVAVFIPVIRM